jgi:hypothetical protein
MIGCAGGAADPAVRERPSFATRPLSLSAAAGSLLRLR